MNDEQLQTIEQVKQFLEGSEVIELRGLTAEEKYRWIEEVLIRFKYHRLKRDEKGVIRRYIERITGYSRAQVSRLSDNQFAERMVNARFKLFQQITRFANRVA